MFDIGTTAVLLDAAQDLNEALQGGAALSLIPIGIGTIVGIGTSFTTPQLTAATYEYSGNVLNTPSLRSQTK